MARPLEPEGFRSTEARLRILLAANAMTAAGVPMLDACRHIGRALCEELGWDFLGIWTLDSGTWALRCTASWARPGCGLDAFCDGVLAAVLAPKVGLPGRAWDSRQVQWFTEDDNEAERPAAARAHTILPPSAITAGLRAGLAMPIRCGEDVLAVIETLGGAKHAPDQALATLLDTIGVQIALAELRNRTELRSDLAQKELEEAREQLESVMTCAPAVIATIARDDTILFLNRQWPFLDEEQTVGASWKTFTDAERQAPMSSALETVFSSGAHQFHQVVIKGPAGRPRWLSNHVGPMRIGGQIAAAVVISQDITEAKVAEGELANAQRLASVGTLAAGVAHEINTPVQFVSDSVHFIRDAAADLLSLVDQLEIVQRLCLAGGSPSDLLDAATRGAAAIESVDLDYLRDNMPKACDRALDGLKRVATIVRSMKEFAHPAQKEMAPTDLNRAIESTLVLATSEYRYVADLETDLGELPPVVCHVSDINQVVLNIVVNAAHAIGDAMKQHGRRGVIKVRTEQRGQDAIISIGDTGSGIPAEIQSRIFDPFFTTKEVGRGTGQGLAIARAIIEDKHGGDLTFETSGEGTTFVIQLPIAGRAGTD